MLSGGQQQRLVIARAMILRPQLVVADEPVSMLDASVRVEILQLLRGLQERYGLSVIYITHDLSTVRYFCERVCVMYGGLIIEQAPVADLLRTPRHPYTQALLAAIPDANPENAHRLRDVPSGEPPSLLHPPTACRFHPRCPAFMPGICDVHVPKDFEPSAGQRVLCWLYDDTGFVASHETPSGT
jgi:peptide/nickel transport system ATP-binding protein